MSVPAEDPLRQAAREQERAEALDAVLAQAPDIGLEEALDRFGQALSAVDQALVLSLTPDEVAALRSVESKLGIRRGRRVVNYNIVNNQI